MAYIQIPGSGQYLAVSSGDGTAASPAVLTLAATVDSEFPAAAALADNTATPTTTIVGAFGMVYDGATWDFQRGTAADGTLVNLGTNNDVVIGAGSAIIGATYDAGPSQTISFGVSSAAVVSADMTTAAALTAAPTAGQKLVIVDIIASSDTAMNILFEEETSGTDIFKIFIPANGTVQITPRGKIKLATADKKLTGKASVAGNVAFTVTYYSEA